MNDLPDLTQPFSPTRVLVNEKGRAISAKRAQAEHGVVPDIIFLREDGWSLGAPSYLEHEAYRLWPGEWVGFTRRHQTEWTPISIYVPAA